MIERWLWRALLAFGLMAVVAALSRCNPGPLTPTPAPTCDACALGTRVKELETWLQTKTATPALAATSTSTATPTPAFSPSATFTTTPSRTPTATASSTETPIPEPTPLTVRIQGIAKPGSYATFVFEFDAPYEASIGLYIPEKCAFYNEVANSTPRVNCVPMSGLCWEVSGSFRGTARVYFLSTWKAGDVAVFTAWIRRQEETIPVHVDPVVIGGGTVVYTPTPRATATRTPGAAQVWPANEWTWIAGDGQGPDLTFLALPAVADSALLWFCDAGFKCCNWWQVSNGPSWGNMIVRGPYGCAEPRWVWSPVPVSVERVRWQGTW